MQLHRQPYLQVLAATRRYYDPTVIYAVNQPNGRPFPTYYVANVNAPAARPLRSHVLSRQVSQLPLRAWLCRSTGQIAKKSISVICWRFVELALAVCSHDNRIGKMFSPIIRAERRYLTLLRLYLTGLILLNGFHLWLYFFLFLLDRAVD